MTSGETNGSGNRHDAILVLGGGVREGGVLPPWAQARFDLALERRSGEPIVCLSAATTHRPPPLDEHGFPILESVAGARYLLEKGVPPESVRIENGSYDTIGNAYYARVLHVDPEGWRKLLIVTSEFHMPRTEAIFEWLFSFAPGGYELEFAASPDVGMTEQTRESRVRKEAEALRSFHERKCAFRSLHEVHRWLFTCHGAYAANARWQSDRSREVPLLDSY